MSARVTTDESKEPKPAQPAAAADKSDKPVNPNKSMAHHDRLLNESGLIGGSGKLKLSTPQAQTTPRDAGYPYPSITLVSAVSTDGSTEITGGQKKRSDAQDNRQLSVDRPLTSEQVQAIKSIETQMLRFLPYFFPPKPDGTLDQDSLAKAKKELDDDNGQFGQAAKSLYAKFVDWMQTQNGPNTLRLLKEKGLPFPPQGPTFKSDSIALAGKSAQSAAGADTLKRLAAAPDLRLDLHIDPTKIPGKAESDNLGSAIRWMSEAQAVMKSEDQKVIDDAMLRDIKSFGSEAFVKTFQPPSDRSDQQKMDQWRTNTETALDLTHEIRRYSEAALALRDAGYYGKLSIPLPPGVVEDPKSPGKLKYYFFNDPHMDSPENQNRLKAFADWKKQYGDGIDSALSRVVLARLTPDKVLSWGDIELTGMQAVLKDGKFEKLAKAGSYKPMPGEEVKDITLLQNRFDVHTDDKGNIVVSQNVQAQTAWGYQNLFGVTNIGEPYKSGDITFKPSDFVPISTPAGMKLIQARDLESYKTTQQFEQYGQKALIATMDGALLAGAVTGVGTIAEGLGAAALAGGRIALKQGAEITARELAIQGAKMGLKLTVAAAGIFNNADAEATPWGSTINRLRGYYFMADIGLGVSGKTAGLLNPSEKANQFLQEQFQKSAWVWAIDKGTNYAFKATEYGYVPQIVGANYGALDRVFGQHEKDALPDAYRFLVDKRSLGQAGPGDFDVTKADVLKGTTDLLTNYETVLARDSQVASQPQVQDIFEKTKSVLRLAAAGDPTAVVAKKQLIDGLLAQEQFNGDEVRLLNQYVQWADDPARGLDEGRPLNGKQLSQLYAGQTPEGMSIGTSEHLREMAEKILAARDPDLEAARRIALLYLSRDQNGKLPDSIASIKATLPFARRQSSEQLYYADTISIDTSSLVKRLRSELAVPRDASGALQSNRGLAVGDVLTRLGAITDHQYADLLGDILESPHLSKADKVQALLGGQGIDYATLVQGVRVEERNGTASKGSSSGQDLLHHLDALAASSADDKDVRALAAMLKFGLAPENTAALPAIVSAARSAVDKSGEFQSGVFSSSTIGYLKDSILGRAIDSTTSDAQLQVRLHAAQSLALLGADNPDLRRSAAEALANVARASRTFTQQAEALTALVAHTNSNSSSTTMLDSLRQTNPELAKQVTDQYVKSFQASALGASQGDASALFAAQQLMQSLAIFSPSLSKEERAELVQNLCQSYKNARSQNEDPLVAAKTLEINAITTLDPQAAIPVLRSAAGLSDDGAVEQSAIIRQLALSKLNQLHYDGMKDLVSKLLSTESDPAVRKTLLDLTDAYKRQGDGNANPGEKAGAEGSGTDEQNTGSRKERGSFDAALQASTGVAHEILEATKTILELEAKGDATAQEAKRALMSQLIKQESFSSDEIRQMNYFLQHNPDPDGRMSLRPLSAQDVSDLYAGRIPSWLAGERGVHLHELAEGLLAKRSLDVVEARRLSLLYLARTANGQLPDTLGSTQVTFPLPGTANSGYLERSYTQTISINTQDLVKRLQTELSSETDLGKAEKPLLAALLPPTEISGPSSPNDHNGPQARYGLTDAQVAWLHDKFPLLSARDYTAAAQEAGNNSMSPLERMFSSEATIDRTGIEAIGPVAAERQREWATLVQYAMSTYGSQDVSQEDAANARAVLFSTLSNNGQPLSTPGDAIPWRKHQVNPTDSADPLTNSGVYWQDKAAEALYAASQPGVLGRDQIEGYLKEALADGNNLSPEARLVLLKAWAKYYSPLRHLNQNPANGSTLVSFAEYSGTLLAAYRAEMDRQARGLGNAAYLTELKQLLSEKDLTGVT